MFKRTEVLLTVVENLQNNQCIVSQLGRVSRDLYSFTAGCRNQCFYLVGAMGSVIPLSLGISLAKPEISVLGIEGDGSLLMNMGALITLKRYSQGNVSILLLDNNIYESTGGQISQPENLKLEEIIKATGIKTAVANSKTDIAQFVKSALEADTGSKILLIKTITEPPAIRIADHPKKIAQRFTEWLNKNK